MMFKNGFGTFGIIRVFTRERRKGSGLIRKLFGGFQKEFRATGIK
jgi:hypothetical protein